MTQDVYEMFDSLEMVMDRSITLFSLYSLVQKRILKNNILDIYNSLPQELHNVKERLKQMPGDNVFSLLTQLDYLVENSKCVCGFVIIKKAAVLNIIDRMYAALPDNIKEARDIQ